MFSGIATMTDVVAYTTHMDGIPTFPLAAMKQ